MADMDVHEKVFPFVCDNPACKKEYNLEGFAHVVALWGFIYLTRGEHCLIGLVCPDCNHTSLKKFSAVKPDLLIGDIEKTGIVHSLRSVVPFSPKILCDMSSVSISDLQEDEADHNCYRIPFGFQPLTPYPLYIQDEFPYSINEENIPSLLEIENEEGFKAVPRIVPGKSVYLQTDAWLIESDASDVIPPETLEAIDAVLSALVNTNNAKKYGPSMEHLKIHYEHIIQNDLSIEEYNNMDIGVFSWQRNTFISGLPEFLEEYKRIRNLKDFELILYDALINKYARKFYKDRTLNDRLLTDDLAWEDRDGAEAYDDFMAEMSAYSDYVDPPGSFSAQVQTATYEQSTVNDPRDAELTHEKPVASLAEVIEEELPSLKDEKNVFKCVGDNWYVKFRGGKPITFSNLERLRYIVHLLGKPNYEFNNYNLFNVVKGHITNLEESPKDFEEGTELSALDIKLSDNEINSLEEVANNIFYDLKKAEKTDNRALKEEAKEKFKSYKSYMLNTHGIKVWIGKYQLIFKLMDRPGPEAEKVRLNIRNQVRLAKKDIGKGLSELEIHLDDCIFLKSRYAIYEPQRSKTDKSIRWHISF